MTYSLDLRERVLDYVQSGGTKVEACRLFDVDRKTIYNWLSRSDLEAGPCGPRQGKINKDALLQHVKDYPNAILRERAEHFGVHTNAIWELLKKHNITKKNDQI